MDIDAHIELCNKRLSQIWKLVQDLQKGGVPPEASAYDILAEKAEIWLSRLASLGALEPGRRLPKEIGNIHLN